MKATVIKMTITLMITATFAIITKIKIRRV